MPKMWVSASYSQSLMGVIYMTNSSDPREVHYNYLTSTYEPPTTPILNSCPILNVSAGNIIWAMEQWYVFRLNITDTTNDLVNVFIAFTDNFTWLNFTFNLVTDVWNRTSGYSMGELNSTACGNSTSGDIYLFNFTVRIKFGIDEISDVDIYAECFDDDDLSDGWEIVEANYFQIAKRNQTEGDTSSLASRGFVLSGYLILLFVGMIGVGIVVYAKK